MSQMLKNTAYDIQVNHHRDVERVSTSLLSSQNWEATENCVLKFSLVILDYFGCAQ